MSQLTNVKVKEAIKSLLMQRLEDRLPPEERKLERLLEGDDQKAIEAQQEKIDSLKYQHRFDIWIENAATRFTNQLSLGTHLPKGGHPDARGDSINVNQVKLPSKGREGFVGSHSVKNWEIDATGNAAALPLNALYELEVAPGILLRDLLQENHPALTGLFSDDPKLAQEYLELFQASLANKIQSPTISGRHKQLLWPKSGAIESIAEDQYDIVVPLYPHSFTHHLYQKVREQFSEENRLNRKQRFDKPNAVEQNAYFSITNLAMVQLGGSNQQNVSQLNARQGGRHYLLSTMPPMISDRKGFYPRRGDRTIFTDRLWSYPLCKQGLEEMVGAVKALNNNMWVRQNREDGLDHIILGIVYLVRNLHKDRGWSEGYQLRAEEKLWLDLDYYQQADDDLRASFEDDEWIHKISRRFADWVNSGLKQQVKRKKLEFDDIEQKEWRLSFEEDFELLFRSVLKEIAEIERAEKESE